MPKVTMTWEIPEDNEEFTSAYNGWRYKLVISEFDEWLRREIKYGGKNEYEFVRERLHDLIAAEGLNIWE